MQGLFGLNKKHQLWIEYQIVEEMKDEYHVQSRYDSFLNLNKIIIVKLFAFDMKKIFPQKGITFSK